MAFHVTQCPKCESTFNTNAQVLEAASGRVRCGSCLSVFDALDNLVETDDASEQESVFVGSHPEDYFNPSAFLTRSSLQEDSRKTPSPIKPTFPDRAALFAGFAKPKPILEIQPEPELEVNLFEQTPNFETSQHLSIEIDEIKEFEAKAETELEVLLQEIEELGAERLSKTAAEISVPKASQKDNDHSEPRASSWTSNSVSNHEDPTLSVSFSMQQSSKIQPPAEMTSGECESPADPEPQSGTEIEQSNVQPSLAMTSEPINTDTHAMDSAAEMALEPHLDEPVLKQPGPKLPASEETPRNVSDAHDTAQNEFRDSAQKRQRALDQTIRDNATEDVSAEITKVVANVITDVSAGNLAAEKNSDQSDKQFFDLALTSGPASVSSLGAESAPTSKHIEPPFHAAVESGLDSDSLRSESLISELTTNAAPSDADADADADAEGISTEDIRARALNTHFEDHDALEVIPDLNLEELGKMAAPVTLGSARRLHWRSTLALAFGCTVLSGTLLAQYFWWYLPLYSQLDRFRPAYVFVCKYVSCQLPPYSNLDAIRSDDLAVRSHPEQPDALSINVSFRNTASFPQVFPVMILSFNSSANEVIALREFSPQEYLSPGLQRVTYMPPNSPVQVQLEIMDPGPFAVNYTLAFRAP
jgi:predicted Zn finger-like uncharacterized protein